MLKCHLKFLSTLHNAVQLLLLILLSEESIHTLYYYSVFPSWPWAYKSVSLQRTPWPIIVISSGMHVNLISRYKLIHSDFLKRNHSVYLPNSQYSVVIVVLKFFFIFENHIYIYFFHFPLFYPSFLLPFFLSISFILFSYCHSFFCLYFICFFLYFLI